MAEDWGELITQQEKGLAAKIEKIEIKNTPSISGDTPSARSNPESEVPKDADTHSDESDDKAVSKSDLSLLQKLLHSRLVNSKSDLEVLRKDPTSPLYSVKSFEALHLKPELLKGIYDMGFNAPSKIQETALPALLADPPANMIAQSQSGTGKTAAFVLTMLSRVDISQSYPQCLCLAPTYELALQIGEVTSKMSKFMTGIEIQYAVRGERVSRGQHLTCHVLIGTPGTTLDWAFKFRAFDMSKIRVFVLDEADVMISLQGHQDQSRRLQKGLSPHCQMLLFSATYDASVMDFAEKVIPNDPVIIKLRREEESLENIKQYYIECNDQEEKFIALANIYGAISIGQSMIFCATKRTASTLAERMTKDGHAVGLLSGELPIEMRADIIKRFRDGKEKVLITTNVSARGIDVEQVTVVVNFDLPLTVDHKPDCETYLHRIGRTGRFGKNGIAINFVDGHRSMNTMRYIEKHFGRTIEKLDADDLDAIEKISTC
ncbi:DEAD-box helicase Dbp80-like [Physella acuta]|uniref:DEAD-box helicase Dbp80-like n=1 Tax=Physella acuta TaxID=109671 RepID=UPI0027DD542E|nr:DEAD-box helicase Dbp80-like [Physella acuta]XP_059178566.1 DEAD-box helicase Dbp80-like [Physella acuta]